MNNIANFPSYLTPLSSLVGEVEVVGEVREKTDREGKKVISKWNGMPGYIVPIEYVQGIKAKALPNGRSVETMNLAQANITIWGTEPKVKTGDYVLFENLAVGAVDGKLFFQATGIKLHESADELDLMGEA